MVALCFLIVIALIWFVATHKAVFSRRREKGHSLKAAWCMFVVSLVAFCGGAAFAVLLTIFTLKLLSQ